MIPHQTPYLSDNKKSNIYFSRACFVFYTVPKLLLPTLRVSVLTSPTNQYLLCRCLPTYIFLHHLPATHQQLSTLAHWYGDEFHRRGTRGRHQTAGWQVPPSVTRRQPYGFSPMHAKGMGVFHPVLLV